MLRPTNVRFLNITIGANATVHEEVIVEAGATIDERTVLYPFSLVPESAKVKAGHYSGNPCKSDAKASLEQARHIDRGRARIILEACKLTSLVAMPLLLSLMTAPSVLLFFYLDFHRLCSGPEPSCPDKSTKAKHLDPISNTEGISLRYSTLLYAITLYLGTGIALVGFTVAMKWLLAGHVRPGLYRRTTFTEWRRWWLRFLHNATVFWFQRLGMWSGLSIYHLYYRALGMRIGRSNVLPNDILVHIEDAHLVEIENSCVLPSAVLKPDIDVKDYGFKGSIRIGTFVSMGFHGRITGAVALESATNVGWFTNVSSGQTAERLTIPSGTSRMGCHRLLIPKKMHQIYTRPEAKLKANIHRKTFETEPIRTHIIYRLGQFTVDLVLTLVRILVNVLSVLVAYEAGVNTSSISF